MSSMFGPYATFIIGSYGIVALIVLALIVWVITDHSQLRRELAELDAQGVTRRSGRKATDA